MVFTFVCLRVVTGSGDCGSSWAAAVDRCCATCPWGMLVTRQFNEPLSQRCRAMCVPIILFHCRHGHGLVGYRLMLCSKDSTHPAKVGIFANNFPHPLTFDPCCIPFGQAMYQDHGEISYFDRVYRIIGSSSSVLWPASVTVIFNSALCCQRLVLYLQKQLGNSVEL